MDAGFTGHPAICIIVHFDTEFAEAVTNLLAKVTPLFADATGENDRSQPAAIKFSDCE